MARDPAEVLKDAPSLPVDDGAEGASREEIHRRLQQIDSSAVQLMPWEDARRLLRAHLER